MTFDELYGNLYAKYGEKFNWKMLSFIDKTYIQEAEQEIKKGHFLYGKRLWSVAKCTDNDDVLFVTGNDGKDLYVILHLTYNDNQDINYPEYVLIDNIYELEKYLIKQYQNRK